MLEELEAPSQATTHTLDEFDLSDLRFATTLLEPVSEARGTILKKLAKVGEVTLTAAEITELLSSAVAAEASDPEATRHHPNSYDGLYLTLGHFCIKSPCLTPDETF